MKNDLLNKRRVILLLTVIAFLFAVWQGAGAVKKFGRLSVLRQQAAEYKANLDERQNTSASPVNTFPQIIFIEPSDESDLIYAPQRHDITVREMKTVEKDTPISEMASRFGGVHGSTGSGFVYYIFFLEDGMYAQFLVGAAESEDGTRYDAVTNLFIGDSTDPENGFLVF